MFRRWDQNVSRLSMSRFKALKGVMYTTAMPFLSVSGCWISCEKIGRSTASVFPLPVGATRSTFLPSRTGGIAITWGKVGSENPSSANALRTGFARKEKNEQDFSTRIQIARRQQVQKEVLYLYLNR